MDDKQNINCQEQGVNLADENRALKAELEALKASVEKERADLLMKKELAELFPSVTKEDIPSDVYEYVETNGGTLVAAYALYHRRRQLEKNRAEEKALENLLKTPGSASASANAGADILFTSDEIRTMSREQVKRNYKQIMKSLKYGK